MGGNFHFELLDDRLERGQAMSGVGTRPRSPRVVRSLRQFRVYASGRNTIALMPRATADSAVLLPSRVRAHRIAVTRVACCRVALLSRPPGAIGSGVPGYVAVAVCVPCRLCRGLHGPLRVMCLVLVLVVVEPQK